MFDKIYLGTIITIALATFSFLAYSIWGCTQPVEIRQLNQYCFETRQAAFISVKCVDSMNVNNNFNMEHN